MTLLIYSYKGNSLIRYIQISGHLFWIYLHASGFNISSIKVMAIPILAGLNKITLGELTGGSTFSKGLLITIDARLSMVFILIELAAAFLIW